LTILPTLILGMMTLQAAADTPAPIRVLAQVPAKSYYVGQAIELRIGAEAGTERPQVVPPSIPDIEISLIDNTLSPLGATGIGSQTSERNLFITRFRLIPHHAGLLRIPPVRVRLGARSGVSHPLSIPVQSLPPAGRTSAFLGGVGPFEVTAEASPSTLRVGQDFLYTVLVSGPAARGMSRGPDLSRLEKLALGLQVEPLTPSAVDSPPSRAFRFRIRATHAGTAALPPVLIAALDPETAHYVTKATPKVSIRVVDVPRFDPTALDYPNPPAIAPSTPGPWRWSRERLAALAGVVLVPALVIALVAAIRRGRNDPGRVLVRSARRLDPRQGAAATARRITDSLAEYLERSHGRPRGALTPVEARSAIALGTQDTHLGERSARLVAACDRARYSERPEDTGELIAEAHQLFNELKKAKLREGQARSEPNP
jgi:hypothetical protein